MGVTNTDVFSGPESWFGTPGMTDQALFDAAEWWIYDNGQDTSDFVGIIEANDCSDSEADRIASLVHSAVVTVDWPDDLAPYVR